MKRNYQQSLLGILFLLLAMNVLATKPSEAGSSSGRKFYLTKDTFTGAQALTACASGYHMASLWEIFDPSNLRYNKILGLTNVDSGSGPPSAEVGWIRTGFNFSDVSTLPGRANCAVWSSDSSLDNGTIVALQPDWQFPSDAPVNPWGSAAAPCNITIFHVWCVQN
ncbi:hypothetical protein L0222_29995 [bacterium]|nr:hypothetical protein [bacterium]MCI0604388.1 hypothetical protein [bacterium]